MSLRSEEDEVGEEQALNMSGKHNKAVVDGLGAMYKLGWGYFREKWILQIKRERFPIKSFYQASTPTEEHFDLCIFLSLFTLLTKI